MPDTAHAFHLHASPAPLSAPIPPHSALHCRTQDLRTLMTRRACPCAAT